MLHADVRVLSRATVLVDGQPGEHIADGVLSGWARFTSLLRQVGADQLSSPDPRVRLDRVREVQPGSLAERLTSLIGVEVPVVG